jgi:phage shock protein PspC (stress-responsive transcriptional regulator)
MMVSEEIGRLHELHQAGALSDVEFAQAKARLLQGERAPDRSEPALVQWGNRLRRSRSDRWLGGICGGLAVISGVESWIWRLAFVLFGLSFGAGAVLYILLWIFVPQQEIGNQDYE